MASFRSICSPTTATCASDGEEGITIEYRVENKYLVSDLDLAVLAGRLKAVMSQDIHQTGDCYQIRSLYFDDLHDSCMDENESGLDQRRKFRIRHYDPAAQKLHLEIKEKYRGYTKKMACDITREECRRIMDGMPELTMDTRKPLNLLKMEMRCALMRPKAIISYERTAFVHPLGNVRITFDRNISASRCCGDFLEDRVAASVPVLPAGMHILEVKYDELLPDFIAQQLELGKLQQTAFSKYYLGRLAIQGEFEIDG